MALVIGENSWTTLTEADNYLTTRFGSQEWFNLSDTPANPGEASKETFLIMAFNALVDKPGYCLTPTLTDNSVKIAQTEMAFHFSDSYNEFTERSSSATSGVKDFKAVNWEEEYFKDWSGDFPLPPLVVAHLSVYMSDNLIVDLEVE